MADILGPCHRTTETLQNCKQTTLSTCLKSSLKTIAQGNGVYKKNSHDKSSESRQNYVSTTEGSATTLTACSVTSIKFAQPAPKNPACHTMSASHKLQ